MNEKQIQNVYFNHNQAWKFVFKSLGLNISDEKPIDSWDGLRNPDSQILKGLMIIYSMETFLPFALNIAERSKDESKIISLGPFAKALNEITWQA